MTSPVIIKGNQHGLRLIIAPGAEILDVVSTIRRGLKNTDRKYIAKKNPTIRLFLEGAKLENSDIKYLRDKLYELGIDTCIDENVTDNPKENLKFLPLDEGLFMIGSIRRGQVVEAAESVIIVGDVEAGAKVISRSNVIIIGRQDGYVEAGVDGKASSFVYSLFPGRNI